MSRILCIIGLLISVAAYADTPPDIQTVRTITATPQVTAPADVPVCSDASAARPTSVIRSISTGADEIVSALAVGQCLAGATPRSDETYPGISRDIGIPTAARRRALPEDSAEIRECVAKAADTFHVEKSALYLILDVEGGTLGQTSAPNTDGSVDIGPMQINNWWLPKLAARGVTADQVMHNLCINIMAGAWIYANERKDSKTVAEAIARYHSPSRKEQRAYLTQVEKAIDHRLATIKPENQPPCPTNAAPCNANSTSSAVTSRAPPSSQPISSGI